MATKHTKTCSTSLVIWEVQIQVLLENNDIPISFKNVKYLIFM